MDEDKVLMDGLIEKSVSIEPGEVTQEDLRKINRYALHNLTAEDVFVFKTVIGDNETDDRNFEPFNLQAIRDMAKLYPGKTIIKDHKRMADSQVARVFDAEIIADESRVTKAGEPFAKCVTKNYMLRTDKNADMIREIQGGIRREVSTGVRPKRMICNICGSDNMNTFCPHWPGRKYSKQEGETTCLITIDGVKEAFELSFVAVPAQPRAGATKRCFAKQTDSAEPEDANKGKEEKTDDTARDFPEKEAAVTEDVEIALRIKLLESYLFTQNHDGERKKDE